MRVLIAGQTFYPAYNGQAIFTTNLAEGLVKRGHEVLVIRPSLTGKPERNSRHGVQIEAIRSVPLNFLHPDVFYTPFPKNAIRSIFQDFKPNIIHIHDHYPISQTVFRTAKKIGIKVVGTNHFMPENATPYLPWATKLKPIYDWLLWRWVFFLYNNLDISTAPSKTAVSIVQKNGLKVPTYAISCGIDQDHFHFESNIDREKWLLKYGLNPEKVTLIFVGRVDNEKRLDILIQAFQQLKRSDIQLAIAGIGAARKDLEKLVNDLNIEDKIHFLGFVQEEDLPALLNSADIFTMPSEAELLSIATLEAMSCGLPIVAAQAGALPELVTNGVNGYLFKAGDNTDAAIAISTLVNHPERWERMGQASAEKAQHHNLEYVVQRYEKLYESVLSKPVQSRKPTIVKRKPSTTKRIRNSTDTL